MTEPETFPIHTTAVRYAEDRAWYGLADNGLASVRCHHRHGTTVTAHKCAAKLGSELTALR